MVRLDCQARNVEFNRFGGLQSPREKPHPYAASPLGRYLRLVKGGLLMVEKFQAELERFTQPAFLPEEAKESG